MKLTYSFIVPVYNRPDEVDELLESLAVMSFAAPFEVVIVEDGSTQKADKVVERYREKLDMSYYDKPNSGPGDSRNYGMQRAKGNYFIILDSDCILPKHYLSEVDTFLQQNYVDCFGGPDAAHYSFTDLQKAINYVMTSFLTTGGIRGRKRSLHKFEPRSFNMGVSKKAFQATRGFGKIHPGEDPDLTQRIWKAGFETAFIKEAYVYHKRRISWEKFYQQVRKFGLVRPILLSWHPSSVKISFWLPTLFVFYHILALACFFMGYWQPVALLMVYLILVVVDALRTTKSIKVAIYSLLALYIQFFGYGLAFLQASFNILLLGKKPQTKYPKLFFK